MNKNNIDKGISVSFKNKQCISADYQSLYTSHLTPVTSHGEHQQVVIHSTYKATFKFLQRCYTYLGSTYQYRSMSQISA